MIAADVKDEFQAFINERIQEDKLSNIETRKIPFEAPGLKDKEVDIALIVNTYRIKLTSGLTKAICNCGVPY